MSEDKLSFDEREQEFFVPEQVILTGPVDDFDPLLESGVVRLEPVSEDLSGPTPFNLGPLHEILKGCEQIPEYLLNMWRRGCFDREWAMALYRITDETEVVDAVDRLNNESARKGRCIGTGPNYLTGYRYTIAGHPYTIAGSPYTIAGSPYTIAGSQQEDPLAPLLPPEAFGTQWALEQIGLLSNSKRTIAQEGNEVRVGVFDTSPFAQEGEQQFPGLMTPESFLTVHHPPAFNLFPIPRIGGLLTPPPVLENHGLSVASLVYAVAPSSDIHLYRVLDKHCRGNLFVLSSAITDFLKEFIRNTPPNGGVINLSLGIRLPSKWWNLGLPKDVLALDLVLALAHCQGLAVVSAAGNGSAGPGAAVDPEYPASLGFVTGVAASNYNKHSACFSNKGDLAAPGGDGYPGDHLCGSPWNLDPAERLEYGLLCPILPTSGFPRDVALWMGTSFSTPLVSGLAALILEDPPMPRTPVMTDMIMVQPPSEPALGKGIIDVPGSLP